MNSDNKIREQFQSKFKDFKGQVPVDGWDRLEKSLNNVEHAVVLIRNRNRRWYATAIAATLLILIGSLFFFYNPVEEESIIVSEQLPQSSDFNIDIVDDVTPVITENEHLTASNLKVTHFEDEGLIKLKVKNLSDLFLEINYTGIHNIDYIGENPEKYIIEEIFEVRGDNDILFAENNRENDNDRLVLSITGRGGLTSYQQAVNTPMTLRSAAVQEGNMFLDEKGKMSLQLNNTAGLEAEMEHSQPVSFGVTVSKSLIDDLYVETGFVYSYLYSKTRNHNIVSQENETQRLHYIGIPLNLNYNLFSLSGLNIYASIGGMVEKDVYGEYRRVKEGQSTETNNPSSEMEITTISQRNPQLSVNAGVGVSYPIYNDLKLYGKIGGAYYFDANNQHSTIYSDSKIVMDLSLGIRYEFK